MEEQTTNARRVIVVNRQIIGPPEPRQKRVHPRKLSDYPHVPQAHRDIARRLSSTLMMGPPVCDELIEFVRHVFTEEEAGCARHLGLIRGKTARQVARAERRPVEQIEPLLRRMAFETRSIAAGGPDEKQRYHLMPVVPGMFEMVMIGQSPETMTPWHRRFTELFEALYDTGYSVDYQGGSVPMVRYLPVGRAIETHPMALPTDQLEIVLDEFDTFGVGNCQCRMAAQVMGQGCGKPVFNCTVMGQWAERGIKDGWLREVPKKEVLAIKREAESHGMVNWMMNVASTNGQSSCSCCGCCCKALRMVNEFNAPGAIAPPHFRPHFDLARCTFCGRCAKTCPMAAIAVDMGQKTHKYLAQRCVGCGLCALACDRQQAVAMQPVPDYKLPYRSWFSMLARALPGMLKTSWKVWRGR